MTTKTSELISDSRQGIRTYTNNFSGDIGQRFKRVDARLERAQEAIEDNAEHDEIHEILQTAKGDVQHVVRTCFTGITPRNLTEYIEKPVNQAVESVE